MFIFCQVELKPFFTDVWWTFIYFVVNIYFNSVITVSIGKTSNVHVTKLIFLLFFWFPLSYIILNNLTILSTYTISITCHTFKFYYFRDSPSTLNTKETWLTWVLKINRTWIPPLVYTLHLQLNGKERAPKSLSLPFNQISILLRLSRGPGLRLSTIQGVVWILKSC